jgi:hypothetical protein
MFQVPKSFKFFSLVFASPSKIKAGADKELSMLVANNSETYM